MRIEFEIELTPDQKRAIADQLVIGGSDDRFVNRRPEHRCATIPAVTAWIREATLNALKQAENEYEQHKLIHRKR